MECVAPVDLAFSAYEPEGTFREKSPIIFLHGMTLSKESWCDIPKIVAGRTKRQVYAIDARNHGDSPWSDDFNLDINALDLLHFMDKHGIEKAILVGHSMGGVTAIKAALKESKRVEKLFAVDIGVKKAKAMDKMKPLVTLLMTLIPEALDVIPNDIVDELEVRKYVSSYFEEHLPPEWSEQKNVSLDPCDPTKLMLKRTEDGRFTHKTNFKVLKEATKDFDKLMTTNVGVYEGPATFIYGTASPVCVLDQKNDIKELFPKAEFLPVQNATHDVHNEFPDEFTAALLEFISKE